MAKRRANGAGTIYQRKDGRWCAQIYLPTPDGRTTRRLVYGKDYDDVDRKLTELKDKRHKNIPVSDERWTVARYLNYWLVEIVKPQHRPKTYQGYEGVVRLHLIPGLGGKRLDRLSAQQVRVFLNGVRDACQCCKHGWDADRDEARCCAKGECCGQRLSPRMVQFVHAVLRNALQSAMREEIVSRNVAKLVQVRGPQYRVNRGLTADQARGLLSVAAGDRLHALYVLALYLGLRRAEALGLAWAQVDLDAGTLEISQTLQRVGGRLQLVPPKTENSVRTVPLPEVCVTALREHQERQKVERSAAGNTWQESGLVFTSTIGTAIEPDNLRRSWYPLREAAGLAGVRMHDLRHTCVTLLLDLGVPPHIVREIVGHADIDVTMTIYAHASMDEKRKALKRLDEFLR